MPTFVQPYYNGDLNAPALTGEAGSLVNLLNQVLVTGYGVSGIAVVSITRTSTTATVTVAAADGFKFATGMYVTISGADQADYNGTFLITRASATTFTYTVANSPATPATGTILASTILGVTSITRSGTTATVTLPVANTSLKTGQYYKIAGANESDYNGIFQITMVDSTHFTYTVANNPTTPATGTILYRKAPLQWDSPYTGTNRAVYRSADGTSNQFYLRVNDDATMGAGAKEAWVRGYTVMSDVNTGTGPFPSVGQYGNGGSWYKSNTADTVARGWFAVGDSRTFYLRIATGASNFTIQYGFGHFITYRPGDMFNTFIGFSQNNSTDCSTLSPIGTRRTAINNQTRFGSSVYIARPHTQLGPPIETWSQPIGSGMWTGLNATGWYAQCLVGVASSNCDAEGFVFPTRIDQAFWTMPLMVLEEIGAVTGQNPNWNYRGKWPGIYAPFALATTFADLAIYDGGVNLPGHLLQVSRHNGMVSGGAGTGQLVFDIVGPWT